MTDRDAERLRRLLHECPPDAPQDSGRADRAISRALRLRRNRRATYAGVVAAVLVAVGVPVGLGVSGGPDASPPPVTGPTGGGCPVTRPVADDRVPEKLRRLGLRDLPSTHAPRRGHSALYGAGDLWVELTGLSGTSRQLKFASFTLDGQGQMTDEKGAPTLIAQLLDGSGTVKGDPLRADNYATATGAHGRMVQFWPTAITLPSDGCWQLTEKLGDTTIEFVIRVDSTPESSCRLGDCDVGRIRRAVRTPLDLPSLGLNGQCPVSTSRRFDAGAGFTGSFRGLGPGPVYWSPVDDRHPARLRLHPAPGEVGASREGSKWLWTKPIWVFDPTYSGPVLLRGARIDGRGRVGFDRYIGSAAKLMGQASTGPEPSVLYPRNGLGGTRIRGLESYPGGLYVREPGCYAIQVDGLGFTEHIVFRAVGPKSGR